MNDAPIPQFVPSADDAQRFHFHKDETRSAKPSIYPAMVPSPSDAEMENNAKPLQVELPPAVQLNYRYVWIKTFDLSAATSFESAGTPFADVVAAQRVVNDPPLAPSNPSIRFGIVERAGANGGNAKVGFAAYKLRGQMSLDGALDWIKSKNPGEGLCWLQKDGAPIAWQLHVVRVASK